MSLSTTYYLKDNSGYDVAKLVIEENKPDSILDANVYKATTWDRKKAIEWLYYSGLYAKWDGCTHWYFRGEDYETDSEVDGYYHLCGFGNMMTHIIIMCFSWKVAGEWLCMRKAGSVDYTRKEYYDRRIEHILKDYKISRQVKS